MKFERDAVDGYGLRVVSGSGVTCWSLSPVLQFCALGQAAAVDGTLHRGSRHKPPMHSKGVTWVLRYALSCIHAYIYICMYVNNDKRMRLAIVQAPGLWIFSSRKLYTAVAVPSTLSTLLHGALEC